MKKYAYKDQFTKWQRGIWQCGPVGSAVAVVSVAAHSLLIADRAILKMMGR